MVSQKIINSPYLFIFLAFCYPVVFMFTVNRDLYTTKQLVYSFVFCIVFVGCLLLFIYLLNFVFHHCINFLSSQQNKYHNLSNFLIIFFGINIISLLLYSPLDYVFQSRIVILFVSLATSIVIGFMFRYRIRQLNIILSVLIVINVATVIASQIRASLLQPQNTCLEKKHSVNLQLKPNIYLFILESYHSLEIRQKIYKIDNSYLENALNDRGFKIFPQINANYASTLPSVSSIFMMKHHYYNYTKPAFLSPQLYYKNVIGGKLDNMLLCILKDNGYIIDFSNSISYLYRPSNYIDIKIDNGNYLHPLELFRGVWGVTYRLFAGFGFEQFNELANKHLFLENSKKEPPIIQQNTQPFFKLIYAGAFHSPDIFDYPDEIRQQAKIQNLKSPWEINEGIYKIRDRYKERVTQSDLDLINSIDKILETDNNSLILLTGDHGVWRLRDSWLGSDNDPTANIIKNGFTTEAVTNDLFAIFLAVRYNGAKIDLSGSSPVNYFRRILNVLSNNKNLFKDLKNDSFILIKDTVYQTVDNGIILDRWQKFTPPPKNQN